MVGGKVPIVYESLFPVEPRFETFKWVTLEELGKYLKAGYKVVEDKQLVKAMMNKAPKKFKTQPDFDLPNMRDFTKFANKRTYYGLDFIGTKKSDRDLEEYRLRKESFKEAIRGNALFGEVEKSTFSSGGHFETVTVVYDGVEIRKYQGANVPYSMSILSKSTGNHLFDLHFRNVREFMANEELINTKLHNAKRRISARQLIRLVEDLDAKHANDPYVMYNGGKK